MKIDQFLEGLQGVPERLRDLINRILQALSQGIEFGSPAAGAINIKGKWASGATPGVADQEFAVSHNLGYVPTGFLTFSVDQSATLYKGVSAWTMKQIFLKCHQTTVNYIVFIA